MTVGQETNKMLRSCYTPSRTEQLTEAALCQRAKNAFGCSPDFGAMRHLLTYILND